MVPRPLRRSAHPSGFTLIELLIVVSLTVVIALAASSLFMTFLIGSTKTGTAQLIKNEGNFAIGQMEFLLRNAIEITNCQADTITFKSADGGLTTLTQTIDNTVAKISSNSAFLTSNATTLTAGPTFTCSSSGDGVFNYVTVTFTMQKGTPGVDQPRDIVQQQFSTRVNVRSF